MAQVEWRMVGETKRAPGNRRDIETWKNVMKQGLDGGIGGYLINLGLKSSELLV